MSSPSEVAKELKQIQKDIQTATKRAVSQTKRDLTSFIIKRIGDEIPELKSGLRKRFGLSAKVVQNSDGTTTTVIRVLSNQPNARRFILGGRKGSWEKAKRGKVRSSGIRRKRIFSDGTGGLYQKKIGGGRIFLKGAFILDGVARKPLVFRRGDDNKLKPIRGYSSLGMLKRGNKTAPKFLDAMLAEGQEIIKKQFNRQMDLLNK